MKHAILNMLLMSCLACSSGGLFTKLTSSSVGALHSEQEFAFASDFPANVQIPDIDGMRSTAFVVSVSDPAGVVAIDLDSPTLATSTNYRGCILPRGTGLPAGPLHIGNDARALLLTSSHLIDCNLETGTINATLTLNHTIELGNIYPLSRVYDIDNDGALDTHVETFTPSFPAGIAVDGHRIFVSFSNYILPTGNPVAAPGIVQEYTLLPTAPFIRRNANPPVVTSAYNPTGIHALRDGELLIVNSGVNRIQNARTVPVSTAGIERYHPYTGARQWIPLGPVALAFQAPTITDDERYLFVSSAAFNTVYMLDLESNEWVYDAATPLIIDGQDSIQSDFISSIALGSHEETIFAGSFAKSTVYPIAIQGESLVANPSWHTGPYQIGHAAGVSNANPSGSNTGIGGLAVRPGIRGVDYDQPDLIALTANPGKLVAIDTARSVTINTPLPEFDLDDELDLDLDDELETEDEFENEPEPEPETEFETELEPVNPLPGSTHIFAKEVVSLDAGPGAGEEGLENQWPHYPESVLGAPQGGQSAYEPAHEAEAVFSIGCGGSIILDMGEFVIADGPGDDFIVFENAFLFPQPNGTNVFGEPAQVSVSTNGFTFTKFPCEEETPFVGCAGTKPSLTSSTNNIDPSDPHSAGGNSFDLADLGMTYARYVRLRDLNCINGGSFDLDAISIVWGAALSNNNE